MAFTVWIMDPLGETQGTHGHADLDDAREAIAQELEALGLMHGADTTSAVLEAFRAAPGDRVSFAGHALTIEEG